MHVDNFTRLVQMPSGRHSVIFVIRAIVVLQCMPVFHCFIDILIKLLENFKYE
jgi:hypothetical protein